MPDVGTPTAGTLQQFSLDAEAQVQPQPNFFKRFAEREGGIGNAIGICFLILFMLLPTIAGCTLLLFFLATLAGHAILFGPLSWDESPGVYEAGGLAGLLFCPVPFLAASINFPRIRNQIREQYHPWFSHPLTICTGAFVLGLPCAATSGEIVHAIGEDVSPGRITTAYCVGMPILATGCGFFVWFWRKSCS